MNILSIEWSDEGDMQHLDGRMGQFVPVMLDGFNLVRDSFAVFEIAYERSKLRGPVHHFVAQAREEIEDRHLPRAVEFNLHGRAILPGARALASNGDGAVTFFDTISVLAYFGADYSPDTGVGDADGNGIVDFNDVISVLANFGATCP